MKYDYFEKDGAVFRRALRVDGRNAPLVHDVKQGSDWVPYQGDRAAPVYFGDKVDAAAAGEGT